MQDEEMFTVDVFVCGVYRGKRKIGKNSLVGALLSGNADGVQRRVTKMKQELEQLGATVSVDVKSE